MTTAEANVSAEVLVDDVHDETQDASGVAVVDDDTAIADLDPGHPAQDMLDEIYNAELACRQREADVEDLKDQLKEAKASLDVSVGRLRRLANRQTELRQAEENDKNRPLIQHGEKQSDLTGQGDQGSADQVDENAWQAEPLTVLEISDIKGFGKKKVEALLERCPTLGALEELRAKIGSEAAEFHELLPKGIGREAADEIEERLLNWVAKSASTSNYDPNEQIIQRATELDSGEENCLAEVTSKEAWNAGYHSFESECQLVECPWTPGEEQDDWIRGWLSRQAIRKHEATEEEDAPPESDTTLDESSPEGETSVGDGDGTESGVSLDDL